MPREHEEGKIEILVKPTRIFHNKENIPWGSRLF